MVEKIKWGIIGPGSISRKFATGLQAVTDAELYAVASRDLEKATIFGKEFGAQKFYDSYEALVNDADVDVVYIGTPHTFHKPHTLLCLNAGKHVLCEKPFAVNLAEAREMVNLARDKRLFLMDALWTRYFPIMSKLRKLLREKTIGDVMLVQADFGFRMGAVIPEHRLFNPELAGGALLDVGIYPVQFASMIYGKQPESIVSQVTLGETGVDELSVSVFKYSDYEMATITTAIRMSTLHEARIMGTQGIISIPNWWHPTEMTVQVNGKDPDVYQYELEGNGYNYEAIEVGRCIREGLTESDVTPLSETLDIIRTMDTMRKKWGLSYPGEKKGLPWKRDS